MDAKFDDKDLKVVISPVVASKLCNMGFPIVKLKPKRDICADEYRCGIVFLFEKSEEFLNEFYRIMEQLKTIKGEN